MARSNGWKRLHEVPEWRWLRADECVNHKVKPKYSTDDHHVRRAYDYKMKYDKFNMRAVNEASEKWPDIFDAAKIYFNTSGSGFRWIIEAAIVADRPPDEIAEYVAIDHRTITTYERLFFDVRHLLQNRGWIHSAIAFPAHKHGVSHANPDHLWKVVAFVTDWETVKSFWDFGEVPVPQIAKINAMFRNKVAMNGALATIQTDINKYNIPDITERALELVKHDEETGSMLAKDRNQSAMTEVLRSIEMRVISAREAVSRREPRRQPTLPPPDIFVSSRRKRSEDEVKQLAAAKIEGVSDGESGKAG